MSGWGDMLCSIHTEWRQRQRYRSACEHLHSFALNPFMTTPLPLPLQCEHPHLIALNPFIGINIIAVVVTQCERTFRGGPCMARSNAPWIMVTWESPQLNRMTDTAENITLPQLRWRAVKNKGTLVP